MTTSATSLTDQVALITGAGSGIGRAAAMRLARAGAKVGLVGRDAERLDRAASIIAAAGGTAAVHAADVTDADAVTRAVDALAARHGPATLLVNNAGAGRSAAFTKMSRDVWDDMLTTNLTSVYIVTRAVIGGMIAAGGGRIVNVASVAGLRGYAYISAYAAAKHGVVGLTRALAVELAPRNITVNAVCPGYVDTPMTQATIANISAKTGRTPQQARAEIEAVSPQNRLFDPDEVAATIAYLLSPDARGINGQAIAVCGGELAV